MATHSGTLAWKLPGTEEPGRLPSMESHRVGHDWSNLAAVATAAAPFHWKDWCWSWSAKTLANWWEELTHWKRLWCWERLKAEGEVDDRGWDGWMASPTQWTWVWASSTRWEAWHAAVHGVTKSQMLLNNNKPHFVCAFKDEGPTEWLEYLLGSRGSHVKNTPNMVSETVG